jgi:hypothetical protein
MHEVIAIIKKKCGPDLGVTVKEFYVLPVRMK